MKINFDGKDITVEEAKRLDNLYQRMKKKYKSNDNEKKKDKRMNIDAFSFEEKFGWPEHLSMKDADADGIQNLVNAVVRSVVNDIMDYEIILLNKGHDMYDKYNRKLPPEAINKIKEKAETAKRDLYRPEFELYLGGLSPDSIMRRIKPEAIRMIRQYKDNKAKEARKKAKETNN